MSSRSIGNGSLTHARYSHCSQPAIIDGRCPACDGVAIAKSPRKWVGGAVIGDLSPSWRKDDWEVSCTQCPMRLSDLSYSDLPPLSYSGGELGVWAWNAAHLQCLAQHLRREDTSKHEYAWLMTYVPGKWKRNRKRALRELERMRDRSAHER